MITKKQKKEQYNAALDYLKSIYDASPPPYSNEKNIEIMNKIAEIAPDVKLTKRWLNEMLSIFLSSNPHKKKRTKEDWQNIFPHYPIDSDGFAVAFAAEQSAQYCAALEKYGIVVIQTLSHSECDITVKAMFEEINSLPAKSRKTDISISDPTSWETYNWPSASKFLVRQPAFHIQAFKNRTCDSVYKIFSNIWQETRLRVTIDNWGIMRGTKNLQITNACGLESW